MGNMWQRQLGNALMLCAWTGTQTLARDVTLTLTFDLLYSKSIPEVSTAFCAEFGDHGYN